MLFPRQYWLFTISSTYVDIVVSENLFHPSYIRKLLKEHVNNPVLWIRNFKVNFNDNNKISFTSSLRHVFPPYFHFYRGFYTSIVEKKRAEVCQGQNEGAPKIAAFYSQFHVNREKQLFHICV